MNLSDISVTTLRRALEIREQIESLQNQLDGLLNRSQAIGGEVGARRASGRRTMSAAARAKIGAAQRARWAKQKRGGAAGSRPGRKMSAAGRARIAAATKARWARWKKEQGK